MTRTALIVEDDPETAALLARYLTCRGLEPTVLLKGASAVDRVRRDAFELVVLDLMLPDADGYEICRTLKLDRRTNLVPVVMVTARTRAEDREHGLHVGANEYITKPFTEADIQDAVTRALAWRADRLGRGTEEEVEFYLRSETRFLEECNRLLQDLAQAEWLTDKQARQLGMAVHELGSNAIEWGHRREADRIVTVTYRADPEQVSVAIRDTGPGFNPRHLPHAAQPEDPVQHMQVRDRLGLREGGFGIMMARGLVDELCYNDTGNEVCLVKKCPPRSRRVPVAATCKAS